MSHTLRLALITDVFPSSVDYPRLDERLAAAVEQGAGLAALPELPLHRWVPATKTARDEDAEEAGGPRLRALCEAAQRHRISLLGGTIEKDSAGRRVNAALLIDAEGKLAARYHKVHLPAEEGFWETSHYEPGTLPPEVVELGDWKLGMQICSDINRPTASQLLAAQGVELLLHPRATPPNSYERWKRVLGASAIMSGCYLASINRPGGRVGEDTGAPSLVFDPFGEVVAETDEPLIVVPIERDTLRTARKEYPGYLEFHDAIYARGWQALRRSGED